VLKIFPGMNPDCLIGVKFYSIQHNNFFGAHFIKKEQKHNSFRSLNKKLKDIFNSKT